MHFCTPPRILHVLLVPLSRNDHMSGSTERVLSVTNVSAGRHVLHLTSGYSQQPCQKKHSLCSSLKFGENFHIHESNT
jgi:hypothetical protein